MDVFRVGQPDTTCFPYAIWAKLLSRRARRSLPASAGYQHAQGYGPLREAIASHAGITRGVRCTPEQVIVTAGAQGALDLIARVLLRPAGHAWIEEPGYQGARGALQAAGASPVPVPVDWEGIEVSSGRQRCPEARLAVVTPSHQFPTGGVMSLSRRLSLLAWADAASAWIVEDDYDSEYRYGGRPLEALQGLDATGRVLYVGTFSKVLFPSLRLGYLIAPYALIDRLVAARSFVDGHLPILEQMALADFMSEGHLVRHVRRARTLYLERRNALVEALRQELGGMLDVSAPESGLHLVAWLPPGRTSQAIVRQAAARRLRVAPLTRFCMQPPPRDGLVFGYATAAPTALRMGVKRLAQALDA